MTDTSSGAETGTESDTREGAPTPPGPSGLPLIGSTLSVVRDPFAFIETAREYGDVVGYDAFGTQFVGVVDPEVIQRVLVSENDRFRKGEYEQQFGELIAPRGVVFTEGEQWRRQRQLLQSAFTPAEIRSHVDEMVAQTRQVAEGWGDGEPVELGETLSTLTLRILVRTLFDLDCQRERGETVREAVDALSSYVEGYAVHSVLPDWVPSLRERRYERAMGELDDLVERLVETRRGAAETGEDLLSMLAAAEYPDGEQMSPQEVRDQLVTFLFAGHETTATALTFAIWLLADDEAAQARMREEVASVCDGDPDFADVFELEYTEAVAREALRLYPPVTELYREPREPTTLGGYHIPSDATLQLSAYSVQRDERWWDDPAAFRPERWLPELRGEDPDRPEYAYFPFGGGPRHCLGMRFAMTELQVALAVLSRRVSFERVTESLDLSTMGLTLDPGPVEVRVRERTETDQ